MTLTFIIPSFVYIHWHPQGLIIIRTDQSHVPLVLVTLSGIGLNCFALKNFWLEMYNSMYNSVLLTNTRSYAPEIAMIMTILRMLFGNSKLKTTK